MEKVQLSTSEVLNASVILGSLFEQKLPVKIAYAMQKNIRSIGETVEDINKVQQSLFEQYSVEGEDGKKVIEPNTPERKKYDEEWNPFLKQKHEIDVMKIPLSVLSKAINDGKMEGVMLKDIVVLYFMFEDDTPGNWE